MFGSEVLEVGIGMALLFLFMSLIATALRELIENFAKSRSHDLERGISELLQERKFTGSLESFYNHPLIASLYDGDYRTGSRKLPSYIPRQSFSLAVLDLAAKATKTQSPLSLETLKKSLSEDSAPNPVQQVVLTALSHGANDLDKIRKTIEEWYDGTMDRVSGWYTRRTARILGVLGLATAVFFNVDAITVAQSLIRDKSLREAVVAQAEKTGQFGQNNSDSRQDTSATFTDLRSRLSEIGFPIGWVLQEGGLYPGPQSCVAAGIDASGQQAKPRCAIGWSLITTICGWLITALAIMLGAPFWFDVMNRFMVVRSTVKPKEKSPDEASVDRQYGERNSGAAGRA